MKTKRIDYELKKSNKTLSFKINWMDERFRAKMGERKSHYCANGFSVNSYRTY